MVLLSDGSAKACTLLVSDSQTNTPLTTNVKIFSHYFLHFSIPQHFPSILNPNQPHNPSKSLVVKSTRCVPYQEHIPRLYHTNFVATNAAIIGDVRVGTDSSIWYATVLRAEQNSIKIGKNSVVLDQT